MKTGTVKTPALQKIAPFGIAILLFLAGLTGFLVSSKLEVSANYPEGTWGDWRDISSCSTDQCGTSEGTKTQERTKIKEICDYSCPVVHFEWTRSYCPEGYSEHDGQCRKKVWTDWWHWHYEYAQKITENHSADVVYEKSSDPHKCHRPSDNTLRDVYGMDNEAKGDFKEANSEWKDSIASNCRQEVIDTENQTISCNEAPIIACEAEGQCPTYCGYKGGTVPDGKGGYKTCESTQACVEDIYGCTDPEAINYNPEATKDDDSCEYQPGEPAPTGNGVGGPVGAPVCTNITPTAPTLNSATSAGVNSILVRWSKVADATHYSIFYGPSSGNYPYSVPDTGNTDNFVINGLGSGCFAVKAVNNCAPGPLSNEVCTGRVLGASNVLGASTLGATGAAEENIFYALFALGSLLSGVGVRKFASSKVR